MNRSSDTISALRAPTSDFAAVRDARLTPPLRLDIDLTTARSLAAGTAFIVPTFAGNSFYVDQSTDAGIATVTLNDRQEVLPATLTVAGGFGFRGPFIGLVIENVAQPGKFLRLRWGTDIDFKPSVFSVTGTVRTQEEGYQYGAAYGSTALIAALGVSQVFAPASNVNGAIVHSAYAHSVSALANAIVLLAKSGAAPASMIDGDGIIAASAAAAGGQAQTMPMSGPVKIAAGKGLWWFSQTLETGSLRHTLYTLL